MITIYQRGSCSSSKKAMQWLDTNKIPYTAISIDHISQRQLISVLTITDNGLDDIVKTKGDSTTTQRNVKTLYKKKFNEGLYFLQLHTEILRTPIIISNKKILIGYNCDEIRQLLSKEYRRHQLLLK